MKDNLELVSVLLSYQSMGTHYHNQYLAICMLSIHRQLDCRGITGIFFWGGIVIFPDFFPVENSHFCRPKTNSHRFEKWKAKKKKKRKEKKVLNSFYNFSYSHFQFSTFPFKFSFFSSQFSHLSLFSLPVFSPYVSKNFLVRSLWRALFPLPPCLLRHCWIEYFN